MIEEIAHEGARGREHAGLTEEGHCPSLTEDSVLGIDKRLFWFQNWEPSSFAFVSPCGQNGSYWLSFISFYHLSSFFCPSSQTHFYLPNSPCICHQKFFCHISANASCQEKKKERKCFYCCQNGTAHTVCSSVWTCVVKSGSFRSRILLTH